MDVDLYFSLEFSPTFPGETSATPRRTSCRNQRSGRAEPCRVVYQKENVARYTGQGRGLTAPSRAASYHGPMPTLSTCPFWNKDGRGLQEHPHRGYPHGIAQGYGVYTCSSRSWYTRTNDVRRGGFFAPRCNHDRLDEM